MGVQRSGTTLAGLILSAHSECEYFEEPFPEKAFSALDGNALFVGYKITQYSQWAQKYASMIKRGGLPPIKFVFCIRDTLRTISSMVKLGWVIKELSGDELNRCIDNTFDGPYKERLKYYRGLSFETDKLKQGIATILAKKYFLRELKLLLDVFPLVYEDLTDNPEQVVKELAEFVGMPYEDGMVNFQQKHRGFSMHGTLGNRKIDKASNDKYKDGLTEENLEHVRSVVREMEGEFKDLQDQYFIDNFERIKNCEVNT